MSLNGSQIERQLDGVPIQFHQLLNVFHLGSIVNSHPLSVGLLTDNDSRRFFDDLHCSCTCWRKDIRLQWRRGRLDLRRFLLRAALKLAVVQGIKRPLSVAGDTAVAVGFAKAREEVVVHLWRQLHNVSCWSIWICWSGAIERLINHNSLKLIRVCVPSMAIRFLFQLFSSRDSSLDCRIQMTVA